MTFYPVSNDRSILFQEMKKIGCSPLAYSIFNRKSQILPIKLTGVKTSLANIIKQEMISCKGDAVLHEHSVSCQVEKTDILLLGTPSVYQHFIEKMTKQSYPTLQIVVEAVKSISKKNSVFHETLILPDGKTLNFKNPVIMGILNITGDSFYPESRVQNIDEILKKAEKMLSDGADILDIGGESTRPGAAPVSEAEELDKVIPVIQAIKSKFDTVISVDTYKAKVAVEAIKAGAGIINDISGLTFDPAMTAVVKETKALAVIMHIQGTPGNMQLKPEYKDVVKDLIEFFDERLETTGKAGIPEDKIIIDPGFGFGKNLEHNLEILKNLSSFCKYGRPILAGISRKSMIGKILSSNGKNIIPPEERLSGTLGAHAAAFMNGAGIFRVHDVKEHHDLLSVLKNIKGSSNNLN